MTKIALAAAAILVAMGSAFAGSDHYGSNNASQPVANIDHALTASIRKPGMAHNGVDTMIMTGPATTQSGPAESGPIESGQGIWGN
jgi:hypothetical protein